MIPVALPNQNTSSSPGNRSWGTMPAQSRLVWTKIALMAAGIHGATTRNHAI